MANFKDLTAKACGSNEKLNSLLTEVDSFQDTLLSKIQEEADPTGMLSSVQGNIDSLKNKAKGLVPELPSIQDLGLQDQLKSIKDLQSNLGAASQQSLLAVSSLKGKFPGIDVDTLLNLDPSRLAELVPDLDLQNQLKSIQNLRTSLGAANPESLLKVAGLKKNFPDFDVDTLLKGDACSAPNVTVPSVSTVIDGVEQPKVQTSFAENVTLADKEVDTEEDYRIPTLKIASYGHNGALKKAKAMTAALIVKDAGGTTDEQKRARDRQRMRNNGRFDYVKEVVVDYTEDQITNFIKLDASKFPKLEEFEKNPVADKTLYDKYLKEVTGYDSDYDYTESNPNIEPFELNDWYAELGRAVPT